MNKKFWSNLAMKRLGMIFWITVIVFAGLVYYVNHYMPKGPMIETGYDVEAPESQGGGISMEYIEDVRELNIPDWAKYIKYRDRGVHLIFILVVIGVLLEGKIKQELNKNEITGG